METRKVFLHLVLNFNKLDDTDFNAAILNAKTYILHLYSKCGSNFSLFICLRKHELVNIQGNSEQWKRTGNKKFYKRLYLYVWKSERFGHIFVDIKSINS